jgi:hypothetical protein
MSFSDGLQRRFLLGPLVAIALLGPAGGVTGSNGAPAPRASGSSTPASPTAQTEALITDALEAEQVYRVDNLVFAAGIGSELEQLRELDASIGWGSTVFVEVPAEENVDSLVVVLREPLPGGGSLCLCEVTSEQDAGLWYARVGPGSKCPKVRKGMRGWSADEAAGWRL